MFKKKLKVLGSILLTSAMLAGMVPAATVAAAEAEEPKTGVRMDVALPAENNYCIEVVKTLPNENAEYEFSVWAKGSGRLAVSTTGLSGAEYTDQQYVLESDEWQKFSVTFATHVMLDADVQVGLDIHKYGDANPTYYTEPSLTRVGENYEYLTAEDKEFDKWNFECWHSDGEYEYGSTAVTAAELEALGEALPVNEGLEPAPEFSTEEVGPFEANLVFDTSTTYQTMDGFGTFLDPQFEGRDEFYQMTPEQTDELIELLYGPEGADFNILRLEAGNGFYYNDDWSKGRYTILPDIYPVLPEEERPDWQKDPSILPTDLYQWDGSDNRYVEICKKVAECGGDKFLLNSWSAPGYMKTNEHPAGSREGGPWGYLKEGWEAAYADYLTQYVKFYKESGIDITHVSPYNEPEVAPDYQGMMAEPEQMTKVVKELGKSLEAAGLGDVRITTSESGELRKAERYIEDILADPEAAKYLGTISGHGYMDPLFAIRMPESAKEAGVPVWMSEFSPIDWSYQPLNEKYTGFLGGANTSTNIMHALNTGVNAYVDWSCIAGEGGLWNQHMIIVHNENEYTVTKRFWAMANYSRFIQEGAVRFDVQSDANAMVQTVGFKNPDGTYAVVVLNNSNNDYDLTMTGIDAAAATPYITDDEHDLEKMDEVAMTDSTLNVTVPGKSTVTYVF